MKKFDNVSFISDILRQYLTLKKQELEKEREDFIVLAEEVERGRRKLTPLE